MRSLISILFLFSLIVFSGTGFAQNTGMDYASAIERADQYFQDNDYINAKASYQMASNLRPGEDYPKEQLKKTMQLLREQMQISGRYTIIIEKADGYFENEQYDAAIAEYRKAGELMPNNNYPSQKISEIEEIKAELARKKAAYNEAIVRADKLFEEKKYEEAKTAYAEATTVFPDDEYATSKVNQINDIIYKQKQQQREYDLAISNAEFFLKKRDMEGALAEYKNALAIKPSDKELQQKIDELEKQLKSNKQYTALIEEADRLYIVKDYKNAREKYVNATKVKQDDSYALDMIGKIDDVVAKKETTEQEDFESAIARGDEYLENRELKLAKSQFEFAARLKPGQQYPKEKISQINGLLSEYEKLISKADQQFETNKYREARASYAEASSILPKESYPEEQIAEIDLVLTRLSRQDEINTTYDSLMTAAGNLYAENQYGKAKLTYQEALEVKPGEELPARKISEIDDLMAKLTREKALNEKYNNLIKEGDRLFGLEEYDRSKQKFEEAAELLPEEQYAQEKISEINQLQADIKAYKEKRNKYDIFISEADGLLAENNYKEAKAQYQQALQVFPAESYPKDKIAEIDSVQTRIAREKELQARYDAVIAEADKLLENQQYQPALNEYEAAIQLKPSESYPKTKRDEVKNILADIRRKAELEKSYASDISKADSLLQLEEYELAKATYESALSLKPNETYPKQQVVEINSILKKLKEEREKAYELAITQGDNHYNQAQYYKAKEAYVQASKLKPGDEYALQRIDDSNNEIERLEKAKQEQYNQAIADADKFYNSKIYDKAIEFYSKAQELKPTEQYPGEMIAKITKLINDNILVDINSETALIDSRTEKKFNFEPIDVSERKNNYILVKAKNLSEQEFKVIMSYGDKEAKNGGTILRIPPSSDTKDYIVRIGTQYKWFSEDNNWVSIYPEGGDIEVSLIRVSKAD